ncbi:MAG: NADPH-cytochrome P450 reductase [Monoraphidium minutum]|nr:MAG: NADPH-cytochrome P450 reductase [Monoraphidium minutum]
MELAAFIFAVAASLGFLYVLYLKLRGASGSTLGGKGKGKLEIAAHAISEPADSRPVIRLLYGTQTGTAERFSKSCANELRRRYGDAVLVEVTDIENYNDRAARLPREGLALFLVATYGDGEPTDNAADFYSWICGEADAVAAGDKTPNLQGVSFGVFGLGNKQYEHFNAVGKRLENVLTALGATSVVRRGDGDDDECIDDDFEKWASELYAALEARPELVGGAAGSANAGAAVGPAAEYQAEIIEGPIAKSAMAAPFASGSGASAGSPFLATITSVRELHGPASDRSCVHVEVDISGAKGLAYETGDHVGVYARNGAPAVAAAAELLGLPLDTVFKLTAKDGVSGLAEPFAGPIALRDALACFADLASSPHREALAALAGVASDEPQRARLLKLAGPEGKADYQEYVVKAQRSLLEVMADFPSAKPGLGLFFGSVAPRLQPRFYSISSAAASHPRSVHVTCSVVKDTMPTGRVHDGVCSSWLAAAKEGAQVPVFIRHSHFRLPADEKAPIVMVGPGTGLAPFRAFLQERQVLADDAAELGPSVLFFGCRGAADYIYEAELASFLESGALGALHVAFSRAGPSKDYVQHRLAAEGAAVWGLLRRPGACLYVCGDARHMAKDVHRALLELVQAHGKMGAAGAEAWVKELTASGRYMRDVW